jgi:hypothetical protein
MQITMASSRCNAYNVSATGEPSFSTYTHTKLREWPALAGQTASLPYLYHTVNRGLVHQHNTSSLACHELQVHVKHTCCASTACYTARPGQGLYLKHPQCDTAMPLTWTRLQGAI